jgi:hypothetical protein
VKVAVGGIVVTAGAGVDVVGMLHAVRVKARITIRLFLMGTSERWNLIH